ncbi:unnamed protein product [Parnassius mnemosyne]|uniref:Uncharacterized protein n=1 Tax=Parnassius mnemosyne TaxID=213953 RepID=A0AAV1KWL3_9NEOP
MRINIVVMLAKVIFISTIIASCQASGIGHYVPAVRSFPVVRYAPFFNFPNAVRSIHAVAPPLPAFAPAPPAPAPLLPAPLSAPVLPPPALPAPYLPATAFAPAPALPAPLPAPVLPAPAFATAYAPAFRAVAPAAPFVAPVLPKIAPALPVLPSAPAVAPTRFFNAVPAQSTVPFNPIVRAVAPTYSVTPYANNFYHYGKYLSPQFLPAHLEKQFAWK